MKIAISNLAWQPPEEDKVFEILKELGIAGVELAPTKYFPDIKAATELQATAQRDRLADAGLAVVSFQSLLFGRPDLTVFGDPATVSQTLDYLERTAWLASVMGAKVLVFGSPKNRQTPPTMTRDEIARASTDFFWKAADRCRKHGAILALEANPVAYGCNFATSTDKAARVVRAVDHDNFRLHLDLGGMVVNGEDVAELISQHADILVHFHASEPEIKPINPSNPNHAQAAEALRSVGYDGWVSVEMLPPHEGGAGIRQALEFVRQTYG